MPYGHNIVALAALMMYNQAISNSYSIGVSGLWVSEWLSLCRARGRSQSGLHKLQPQVYIPVGHKQGCQITGLYVDNTAKNCLMFQIDLCL